MPLGRRREPFDHPEWIFKLKYDGFRALLSISVEHPGFMSLKANAFTPKFVGRRSEMAARKPRSQPRTL
jgi:ATP-dependent DNA ligase